MFLYTLAIRIFVWILHILAPFHQKAGKMVAGRKSFPQKIEPPKLGKRFWVHCASLGEFEQARPVIEALQALNHEVVITFFSPSGYEHRKNFPCTAVHYLPWDLPSNAKKWLEAIQPDALLLIKYEFWYHHINACLKNNVPVYVVSATFRANHFLFSFWGKPWLKLLRKAREIFVQDAHSLALIQNAGIAQSELTGDTRYDRVAAALHNFRGMPEMEKWIQDAPTLILGSSWPEEDDLLYQFLQTHGIPEGWKIIIAPHDVNPFKCEDMELRFAPWHSLRYSQLATHQQPCNILIIDNVGMLSNLYAYGKIALIGGGFGRGLHNILEALAFGVPVFFGPQTQKFPEAAEALQTGAAIQISDYPAFEMHLQSLIQDPALLANKSVKARTFVSSRIGATEKIVQLIQNQMQ